MQYPQTGHGMFIQWRANQNSVSANLVRFWCAAPRLVWMMIVDKLRNTLRETAYKRQLNSNPAMPWDIFLTLLQDLSLKKDSYTAILMTDQHSPRNLRQTSRLITEHSENGLAVFKNDISERIPGQKIPTDHRRYFVPWVRHKPVPDRPKSRLGNLSRILDQPSRLYYTRRYSVMFDRLSASKH